MRGNLGLEVRANAILLGGGAVDLCLSAAAARRLISVGSGARSSAARRRRRGVLRLLTPISHFLFSTFFTSFTVVGP
jgi:hypothetical protein